MNPPPAVPEVATYYDRPEGLAGIRLSTALATAELTLHGAHVTHFQPAGAAPVLFLSRSSHFTPGKPIRGGVPICFPWFGPRSGRPESPAHGFARLRAWDVEDLRQTGESAVAVLRLESDAQTRAEWPLDFIARLRVELSAQLALTLEVENTGATAFQYEEALHTYFAVADARQVAITGLEGAACLDKTDGLQRKQLGAAPLRFTAETDLVFPATEAACTLEDPGHLRRIVVEKSGSRTTVVWNPWIAKAAAMADFGDEEWPLMACIETANTGDDAITLGPGERHAMTARIRVE